MNPAAEVDAVTRLDAIEQIKTLKARYFRFVDTKDWESLREVFSEDARVEVPEAVDEPKNREEMLEFFAAAVDGSVSVHFGHMPEIEILTENTARGVWPMDDRIYWPPDRAALLGYSQLRGFGHYHETYVRVDDRWQIQTMRLTRLRLVTHRPPISVT